MNVLHVLPDLALGGGQVVLARHVAAGDPSRVRHHVAWFGPARDVADALADAGAELHDLSRLGAFTAFSRLLALVRDTPIDLLHTNGTPVDRLHGHLAAWRCGIPAVTTLHGLRPDPGPLSWRPRAVAERIVSIVRRRVLRALDRRTLAFAVAVSEAVLSDWADVLDASGLPIERRVTIHSGVPLAEPSVAEAGGTCRTRVRGELGIDPDAPLLVSVARLDRGKRLELLLPLLARVRERHPGTRLLLVGDGGERESLERRARALGCTEALILGGRRDDVPELLAAADLFVFPSGREGFGLVVLEALAAGLPVLATALPSLQRLRDLDAGLLDVDFTRVDEAAAVVLRLLDDPAARARVGERGRRVVAEHFDVRASARRLEDVYAAVLAIGAG